MLTRDAEVVEGAAAEERGVAVSDPQAREMCQWTRAYRWADQGGEDE